MDYVANATADQVRRRRAERVRGTRDGGTGYAEKTMVNVPIITDKLAMRTVLDYRQDAGYVSNSGTGRMHRDHAETVLTDLVGSLAGALIDTASATALAEQGVDR